MIRRIPKGTQVLNFPLSELEKYHAPSVLTYVYKVRVTDMNFVFHSKFTRI